MRFVHGKYALIHIFYLFCFLIYFIFPIKKDYEWLPVHCGDQNNLVLCHGYVYLRNAEATILNLVNNAHVLCVCFDLDNSHQWIAII